MNDDQYRSWIEKAYAGELYGEHLFSLMAKREQDSPKTRQIWQLISDVEKLTGQRIQPLAVRLGAETESLRKCEIERAEQKLAELAEMNECEIAEYYRPLLPPHLLRLKKLAKTGPLCDQPVLEIVVVHSELFLLSMEAIVGGSQDVAIKGLKEFLFARDSEKFAI